MSRIGRRFVPQSTINRRVQAQDDRRAAELAARTKEAAEAFCSACKQHKPCSCDDMEGDR